MSSMTAQEATWRPMQLRHAVQDGAVVALTFRGKPYGYVVPADRWHAMNCDGADEPAAREERMT